MISVYVFQSTHPRGVRLFGINAAHIVEWFQSTHPRGVRHRLSLTNDVQPLFQSTHPRGVRLVFHLQMTFSLCFNPRTHEGCDVLYLWLCPSLCCFNPRTHEGCDSPRSTSNGIMAKFQSTHPRGVRRSYWLHTSTWAGFNPRTHEGCDYKLHCRHVCCCVSIHAPTRGATRRSRRIPV